MTYFKTWLIYTILSAVLGAIVGAIVGFIVGAFMGGAGVPLEKIQLVCAIAGFIVGLPISFLVFRWVVGLYFIPKDLPADQFPTAQLR